MKTLSRLAVVTAIVDRKFSGLRTRDESRQIAKALRVNPKVAVKADVKDGEGWSVKFEHNDGHGTLSMHKIANGKTYVSLSKTHVSLAKN